MLSLKNRLAITLRIALSAIVIAVLGVVAVTAQSDEQDAPYLNPDLPIEERVEDLFGRMTQAEKFGQMTLIEKNSMPVADVTEYFIGGVLSGGGGYPTPNTPEAWAAMVDGYQDAALATRLGIPMIYGVDAVHGHNNVYGAVIFPHNIGLGATRNPAIVESTARITAKEMIATGIYWNYAPVLAVPKDIRWGRAYEGFSENAVLVDQLALAYLHGLQGDNLADPSNVLGTPKHYIGDGGTTWGSSPLDNGQIDRGVTEISEEELRGELLPPYINAIEAGALNIMVSYSSWGGLNMHAQHYLVTEVLKGELGFEGFVVSDWAGVDEIADDYYDAVVTSINAGVDMNMVPYDYRRFIGALETAVEAGDITQERIDDAVRRILYVKFAMGLFETPFSNPELLAEVGSEAHRAVARDAVSQSLVLLKNNEQVLPLAKDTPTIFVAGEAGDNIGLQLGGWSIDWQGGSGNITEGTTILQAIQDSVSADTAVHYNRFGRFERITDANNQPVKADIGIVVIAEPPYAEMNGDDGVLELPSGSVAMIERVRSSSEKLVIVLMSGRPLVITEPLVVSDAFVAAWLPGTEAHGITDVLFGDKQFSGKLPFTWLRNIEQLPFDLDALPTEGCDAPLFPFGYGLTTADTGSEWLDLAVECAGELTQFAAEPIALNAPEEASSGLAFPASDVVIAPVGVYGETYYAPFPVNITLDGDFSDWAGVPLVTVPPSPTEGNPSFTFAAAADGEYLYFAAIVPDENIISGVHGSDFWNEDSVEFYVNATGDLSLASYTDGVVQLTFPPINSELTAADELYLGGNNQFSVDVQVHTVQTEAGYAVEVAVPLKSTVWDITPEDGGVLGFQTHLNSANTQDRSSKLIWSLNDPGDQSYLNPSLFGELVFYAVQTANAGGKYQFTSKLAPDGLLNDFESGIWLGFDADNSGIGFVPWGNAFENTQLSTLLLQPHSGLAVPEQDAGVNSVLSIAYDLTEWGGFTHAFTDGSAWVSQDWTRFNALSFWLYGNETGGTVQVEIFDNRNPDVPGDTAERWFYHLTDDYSGWQQFTIPFELFQRRTDYQPGGALDDGLNLNAVSAYAIGFPAGVGAQVAYLDNVRLTKLDDTSEAVIGIIETPEPFVVDTGVTWESREWSLIWSDEFDAEAGAPLNDANWTAEIGGQGWGNNESQFYTGRVENVSHDGEGNLAIVAREENPDDYICHYGKCEYTSARIVTMDKFEFTYGRVEARLKLPRGQGIWPAFWMLGADFREVGWPNSGEIDIMEYLGHELSTLHGTIHGPGYSGGGGIGGSLHSDVVYADDYHVFAIEWDPNVIRWYVDGELFNVASVNDIAGRRWVFDHDFFMILNVAVGGQWPGYPDETTEFPQTMLVDYVRVYQLAETAQD